MERSIQAIWKQDEIPVILRRTGKGELLRVRLPFDGDNRQWLQNARRITPSWIASRKFWEIPKAWFDDFVNRALHKYGRLYVIQPYREQEVCSPSCQNAKGHECQCSCMGVHHGSGSDASWFEVSDAFDPVGRARARLSSDGCQEPGTLDLARASQNPSARHRIVIRPLAGSVGRRHSGA